MTVEVELSGERTFASLNRISEWRLMLSSALTRDLCRQSRHVLTFYRRRGEHFRGVHMSQKGG